MLMIIIRLIYATLNALSGKGFTIYPDGEPSSKFDTLGNPTGTLYSTPPRKE